MKHPIRLTAWKMVFDSLWNSFSLRFQGILEGIRKHRDLIDAEANAISITEAKSWRSEHIGQINHWRVKHADEVDKAERERLATQTREAVAWLNAGEEQENTLMKLLKACNGTSDHWALKEATILSWIEQGREPSFVWLNGKPGAGECYACPFARIYLKVQAGYERDWYVEEYDCQES